MIIRIFLIIAGTLSLMLGVLGIFVPGLPTTPFLLLTAGLYARSSDRLYQKLLANRYLGPYILRWRENPGFTLKSKILIMLLTWTMISISVFLMIDPLLVKLGVLILGLISTIVISLIIPTIRRKP